MSSSTDAQWSALGETFSVAHQRYVYHFRPAGRAYALCPSDGVRSAVRLTAVDALNSDASVPGRCWGVLPAAVSDALEREGLRRVRP